MMVCNQDCFHCPYEDCILGTVPKKDAKTDSELVDRIAIDPEEKAEREEKKRRHRYYIEHREECLQRSRKWRSENRERALAGQREWYYTHRKRKRVSFRFLPKPVIAIDKNGNETRYLSINAAARAMHLNPGNICSVCKGTGGFKTTGGYRWRYAEVNQSE